MVSFAVHHHHRPQKSGRHHHWWFVALAAVVAIVATAVAVVIGGGAIYAGSVASSFDSHVSHIQRAFPADASRPAATQTGAMNVLLIGSDSRGAPTGTGAAGVTNQRADTMMLVHIDADRRNVYVMSIMRDLWVPIPGNGTAKINAALAWGGTPLAVQTVEQLLGTRIDHVAIIDFSGLKDMTDALGGVDVDSPVGFTTVKSPHYTFVKGMNHLDGAEALAYARERYAFPTADYQRVADQQALMRAFGSKLLSLSVLTDPGKLTSFAATAGSYVKVDQGFGLQTMLGLAASMRLSGMSSIHTFTLPTGGTGTSADGQSIVNVDPAALERLREALAKDALGGFTG
ncbi:LCP family protein [Leifsonia shinshuensis]|uniref:LCP family protein n=1 Tax=Leifsonia TaxID=110932 RepID=UPI00285CB4C2|nr:LCP family protein [Leifsonia shinshuensis]MDR6969779.1 LCP family protein required for cell wall assembly [Leifsonia shinshuensis]